MKDYKHKVRHSIKDQTMTPNPSTPSEAKEPEYLTNKGELAMKRYNEFATFRKNLLILRASRGESGEQMATLLKLKSAKRVLDYECGRCHPSFDEIRTIARHFEITIDQLMYHKAVITFFEP